MNRLPRLGLAVVASLAVGLPLSAATLSPAVSAPADHPGPARPDHVVLIVLDQFRPEYITPKAMPNVTSLMHRGVSFPNAYLGHMASETVVSHNVMTSGLLPKHMGWADEWYRDTDNVLGGGTDAMYVSGSMAAGQFDALVQHADYPKLADYLHSRFPHRIVAAVGQKNYAVNSMGAPSADLRITFGGRSFDCNNAGANNWRGPTGPNGIGDVPSYLKDPTCGRFYVNAAKTKSYGTAETSPAWMYPLEGDRDIPGDDPAHQGGDVWTADVASQIMDHEDWSGLLLTFGGIDKAGHMWGGITDKPPYPPGADAATHRQAAVATADAQVGKVVAKLKAKGLYDRTLVVVTTDHAQLSAKHFYGVDGAGRGNFNWYYGADADESYLSPQPAIQQLIDGTNGNVRASMQDSAIRTWLVDRSASQLRRAADVMATLPGVQATYYREGDHYVRRWKAPHSSAKDNDHGWFDKHAQELVDTEAASYGPDVIGLLKDDTSYGVQGDHGGAQEQVQRIPMIFEGPGVARGDQQKGAIRSVDIMPTILSELGIRPWERMDGKAYNP
jgi:predicted AlkP superfamily pyrophosphatase or phosphodiesterase